MDTLWQDFYATETRPFVSRTIDFGTMRPHERKAMVLRIRGEFSELLYYGHIGEWFMFEIEARPDTGSIAVKIEASTPYDAKNGLWEQTFGFEVMTGDGEVERIEIPLCIRIIDGQDPPLPPPPPPPLWKGALKVVGIAALVAVAVPTVLGIIAAIGAVVLVVGAIALVLGGAMAAVSDS